MFKKYFIPHGENGHAPHFLRAETLLAVIALLIVCEALFLARIFVTGGPGSMFAEILPSFLASEANASRASDGIAPLADNALLAKAARMKAEDMAAKGYFAHTSPEGISPWYWLTKAGYAFSLAGENLAVDFFDSKDVADAWMASPKHRANIVNGSFTEIGIGLATGMHEGKQAVFVVEFFGHPANKREIAVAPSVTPRAMPSAPVEHKENAISEPSLLSENEIAAAIPSVVEVDKEVSPPVVANKEPVGGMVEGVSLALTSASPRRSMNGLLIALAVLIIIAVAVKTLVSGYKGYAQKHDLIVNGLVMLVIIASVILLNGYVSFFSMSIV